MALILRRADDLSRTGDESWERSLKAYEEPLSFGGYDWLPKSTVHRHVLFEVVLDLSKDEQLVFAQVPGLQGAFVGKPVAEDLEPNKDDPTELMVSFWKSTRMVIALVKPLERDQLQQIHPGEILILGERELPRLGPHTVIRFRQDSDNLIGEISVLSVNTRLPECLLKN